MYQVPEEQPRTEGDYTELVWEQLEEKQAEDRLEETGKVYESIWLSEELFSNVILFRKK